MTEQETPSDQAAYLRKQAEELARGKAVLAPKNLRTLSPKEIRLLIHELHVHQVELEMQNEELRRTQMELETSRGRYFDLYDLAPVGYCTLSREGLIMEANLTAASLLGVTKDALAKQPLGRFVLPEDQDIYYLHRKQLLNAFAPQACELRIVKNGMAFWMRMEATAMLDVDGVPVCRVVMSDITRRRRAEETLQLAFDELEQRVTDRTEELMRANEKLRTEMTERKQVEERLHASLREKEILLGEVHHRVKNNMQVISGLLDLQARSSGSPELTGMLNESKRRIRSMALIHEKLYGSKDFARINLADYVRALSSELIQFHEMNPGEIDLIVQTAGGEVHVDINKAIPCGLILNELISNALKHAFPGNGPGELWIIINEIKNKEIGITVRDNGLGLPDDVDIHQPRTVGLYLVNGLVRNQLDGQIEVRRDAGTEFRIKFPYELSEERS